MSRLAPSQAKELVRRILDLGQVALPSRHCQEEMDKDGLDMQDVRNVLRGGVSDPAEFENGTWRYRFRTQRMAVIVAFRSETEIKIVTAWRYRP